MPPKGPLDWADQLSRAKGSLEEIHRTENLDLPTIKAIVMTLPEKETRLPRLTDPSLEPAKPEDRGFPAIDREGYVAVFKDRRMKPRREREQDTSTQASSDQSNPPLKEKVEEKFQIVMPMAGGGTVDLVVTREQRDLFVQKAMEAQDLEQKKKSSEISSNRVNTVFSGVGAVLLLLGIIFGIRAEMRPAPERIQH